MQAGIPHKPFLVGIDESGRSDEAVHAALAIGRAAGAEVYFVHALPPAPGHPEAVVESMAGKGTFAERAAHVRKQLLGRLALAVQDAAAGTLDLEERLRVVPGPPAKALLELAREHDVGTIFIGPHKERGLFDFGSTARAVLAKTQRNVWMQPGRFEPIRSILVLVDLSEDSLLALSTACSLGRALGASVTVLHCFVTPEIGYAPGFSYPMSGPTYVLDEVRDSARAEFESLMARQDWQGVPHELRFLEGRPAPTALELSEEHGLIALGSHGRTGLSAALLGNVAYQILKESRKPVLAIRHPDRNYIL